MRNRSTFISLLHPIRPGFIEQMVPAEEAAMQAHAAYLSQLLNEKTLFLAGPCLDRVFGCAIFEAESLEVARQIMAHDPSVERGVMTVEVHPFNISFLRQ